MLSQSSEMKFDKIGQSMDTLILQTATGCFYFANASSLSNGFFNMFRLKCNCF